MPASGFGINRRLVRVIVPSGFGIATSESSGITRIIVRVRGHLSLGVQLELGATAPPFEDRGLRGRGSGTIVREGGAGSGAPPVIHYLLPGYSPAASPSSRRNPVPGELTRTIVRYRTGGPAVPARRPALIKKFILGVDI